MPGRVFAFVLLPNLSTYTIMEKIIARQSAKVLRVIAATGQNVLRYEEDFVLFLGGHS